MFLDLVSVFTGFMFFVYSLTRSIHEHGVTVFLLASNNWSDLPCALCRIVPLELMAKQWQSFNGSRKRIDLLLYYASGSKGLPLMVSRFISRSLFFFSLEVVL